LAAISASRPMLTEPLDDSGAEGRTAAHEDMHKGNTLFFDDTFCGKRFSEKYPYIFLFPLQLGQ